MENKELWQSVLAKLELEISRPNFLTWFHETGILNIEGGLATIYVPNGFAKEWLRNKYHKTILHTLKTLTPEIREIDYTVAKLGNQNVAALPPRERRVRQDQTHSPGAEELSLKDIEVNPETNLNPRYTFDNFVVGSFNELAHAAAQSVIKNLGTGYNPLFIYGGVGLGKTHLIQAVGNQVLSTVPDAKVRYVPSEKFMGEIVESLKNQEMDRLKKKYRNIDLLIMDDIQFIARTEKMQEEFFHTFNALYEKNKQVVISSDRPPRSIATLEERLRSRFEGGMIADVGFPDFETRLLILKTKATERRVSFPETVLSYLASNIKTNIRELEGALNKLIVSSKVSSSPIDLEAAKKVIASQRDFVKRFVSAKKVVKAVADFYEIEEKILMDHTRRRDVVKPRHIAMWLLREELKASYPSIGERFGGRDHTTAIHSCEKVEEELKKNPEFADEIQLIKDKIYSS